MAKNELRFSSVNVALPFLAEHELPKDFEEGEDDLIMPDAGASAASGPTPAGAAGTTAAAESSGNAAKGAALASAGGAAASAPVDEKVQRLMALGFSQQQSEVCMCVVCGRVPVFFCLLSAQRTAFTHRQAALNMCNGNEELAASVLFGG